MMEIEGSESISQRHGSADPDPHQNDMDPQHWFRRISQPTYQNLIPILYTQSHTHVKCFHNVSLLAALFYEIRIQWPFLTSVPEIIDTVFAKTSPKRSFSMTEYERFGLVFTKTRVYKFGHRSAGIICRFFSPLRMAKIGERVG